VVLCVEFAIFALKNNRTQTPGMNNKDLEKRVESVAGSLVYEQGYVCAVDVLLRLGYLSKKDHDDWRFGRVPFLERVCQSNLKELSLVNSVIRKFAQRKSLKKSQTVYNKWGSKGKAKLTFSKSGDRRIEELYATHYVDLQRTEALKQDAKTP